MPAADATQTRMAEVLGGLSLACDVANGTAPEKVLRTVILAVELARRHGASEAVARDVYYVNILRFLGCVAFAHEETHHYGAGDDIGTRRVMATADAADPVGTIGSIVRGIGAGGRLGRRVAAVARILGDGVAVGRHADAQCDASARFAQLTTMGTGVVAAMAFVCERFDGRGAPHHARGDAIPLAMRAHHLADGVELALQRDGRAAAIATAKRRAGGWYDPDLVATFVAHADELLALIDVRVSVWDRFLACEPRPHLAVGAAKLDDLARAFALFADLKSTWTLGHSTGVATLCERAGAIAGLPDDEARDLRRAAWLHDLGRVAVPNGIWDKPGALTLAEWERVRMHAYWTERALVQARPLRSIALLAAGGHERNDGTGYHRSVPSPMLARAARILAAADAFHAMREARPHRPARDRDAAARELLAEVEAGRLDREAASAVLEASGVAAPRLPRWPCDLTDREVEVLRHVARGASNKQIGAALGISARTVQHHVAHAYAKIGVASRAGASLFVMERGLLE